MLTKNEITALSLSPTKKDFVQIWNELLEVAGKLSERWDPTSTNESDPGIVILKALTGIADKLNYNIDKNTLEAFMPTAAQEDSMRKLCDMLGYTIKYYRSAETEVTIKYHNSDPSQDETSALESGLLLIPKFTTITNSDKDINYFTTNQTPYYISATTPYTEPIPCMEGQIVKCESTADNNVITISQISENNRFYLPEAQVAENGIFVYNVYSDKDRNLVDDGTPWEKVDNLNVQVRGSRVFKFGYDSYESRPYIEFPEDYSELINDGLFIYYARTNGANGNISPGTLTQIELPSGEGWDKVSAESFSVENTFAATSGANIETIGQAYNNFKKTVGTFETLVTCRDYMNKIYTMSKAGKPLVSNILVTDIRNDLNRAVTICSCDDAGIFYKETSLTVTTEVSNNEVESSETQSYTSDVNKPVFNATRSVNGSNWFLGSLDGIPLAKADFIVGGRSSAFNAGADGDVEANSDGFWHIYQPKDQCTFNCKTKLRADKIDTTVNTITKTVEVKPAIDHFDLVLYPFKSYNQIRNNVRDIQEVYDSSFKYSLASFNNVKDKLDEANVKTIAHNIVPPREHDIVSINNYLRLSAIIGTNSKITAEEGEFLKENIKIALANAFNMRELDFGEEIPFESIVEVIEKADSRIKIVSLNEPALYTTFSVFEGLDNFGNIVTQEYAVASDWLTDTAASATGRFENKETNTHTFNTQEAKKIYNKLAVRNVLAGRVPLFKYNTTYSTDFSEGAYTVSTVIPKANKPDDLEEPSAANPFTIYVNGDKTYTGEYITLSEKPEGLSQPEKGGAEVDAEIGNITYKGNWEDTSEEPTYAKIVYTEKATPQKYAESNVIKNDTDAKFTSITTSCKIKADPFTNSISNVTLAAGEFIKFRAPNFSTDRTYPAYVNYHLKLNDPVGAAARPAEAKSLFALLNTDSEYKTREAKWEEVLKYLARHKKTFRFTQRVSASSEEGKDFIISIDNSKLPTEIKTPADVLAKSGCVKLRSGEPILEWSGDISGEEALPEISALTLSIPGDIDTQYFTSTNMFVKSSEGNTTSIPDLVDRRLSELVAADKLPKSQAWTISYEFEYVPFDGATLADWGSFVKDNGLRLFGFTPAIEGNTVLWRTYGEGYIAGKYILESSSKLMPFTSGFLSALDAPLNNVYVAQDLGSDIKANTLNNNEEYMLRSGEYLYIEYTPSTTTEEGTTQAQDSIKEILGPGTIIRPNGFEQGLMDSAEFEKSNTPHKQVTFSNSGTPINMFSFGANEQVEIRDFAKVVLNKDSFTDSSVVSFYKNFNNCEELEVARYNRGKRINNSYTLKDGEYIFYTDQNKTELAYFTTGTEVTLEGKLTIPKFDIIDLATIFDSGLDEIPWVSKNLTTGDSITFQEFQYITLGPGDALKQLTIMGSEDYLNENWQSCDEVEYYPAGVEEVTKLPKINISDEANKGNGWKACSIFELSASPSIAQTLRKTDKVETSITLHRPNSIIDDTIPIEVANVNDPPISFKTNLPCQSSVSKINISDIYNNPNSLDSFELKVFAEKTPALMQTIKGTLLPYHETPIVDSSTEWVTAGFSMKNYGEIWNQVALAKLAPTEETAKYDNTLRLSASILPNTYGIFSIYLDYGDVAEATGQPKKKTWIQLLPGETKNRITLFNTAENNWFEDDKLELKKGINCIRVNKTGDIFIKTERDLGILYFDDLRLVDATPIKYIEGGEEKSLTTLGLNLSQIGYLDASSESSKNTFNVFDMRLRRKLRDDYTNKAIAELESRDLLETKNIDSCWKALTADKAKLQTLVEFLDSAKQEIEHLKTTDYAALFAKYKAIYNSLTKEQALKDVLDNNQNIDSLEQQLITLLDNFTNVEASRQEILTKLEQLKAAAEANAENFTTDKLRKGDILDDFEAVADTRIYPYLVEDIKFASVKEITTQYGEQLDALATDVDEVLDSAKENLLAALTYLNTAKQQALLKQVESLVTTYTALLTTSVTTAVTVAEGVEGVVDYPSLVEELTDLQKQLSNDNIGILIASIESAAEGGLYSELAENVNALKQLLETNQSVNNDIDKAIDALLDKVQAKGTSTAVDASIKEDLSALKDLITEHYSTKITTILNKINIILGDPKTDYEAVYNQLNSTTDLQVTTILRRLDAITHTQEAYLAIIDNFGTTSNFDIKVDYESIPFGKKAILTIWPKYMRQAFIFGVDQLYTDVRRATGNSLNDSYFYYEDAGVLKLRFILSQAANLEAFRELFESAKTLANQSNQIEARKELIEQLSDQIVIPASVKAAMSAISSEDRNAVIYALITQLSQPAEDLSVAEKQQLFKELKEELNKAIDLDSQLEAISAKLLCPSILIFEKELPGAVNDSFYDELGNFVEVQKEALIAADMSSASLEALKYELDDAYTAYNTLLTAFTENNQTDVIAWTDLVDTLLADEFVENLSSLASSATTKDQIAKIYECKLFTYIKGLKDEFVIAWEDNEGEDNDGNWMDSTGQYFKKGIMTTGPDNKQVETWYTYEQYTSTPNLANESAWVLNGKWKTSADESVDVELKHTNAGKWLDCRKTPAEEILIKDATNEWLLKDGGKLTVSDEELNVILDTLLDNVSDLANNRISAAAKEAYATVALEEDILKDIRAIDKHNNFYYNVPIEANVAIDFNESDDKLNTLMNPAVNYDINNVNNPFVISKLDINYLTKGLQIARSSKLS